MSAPSSKNKILACEKEIYLMGDFNRDLLQVNTNKTWLEYMESFGLEKNVVSPTRTTEYSETLMRFRIMDET